MFPICFRPNQKKTRKALSLLRLRSDRNMNKSTCIQGGCSVLSYWYELPNKEKNKGKYKRASRSLLIKNYFFSTKVHDFLFIESLFHPQSAVWMCMLSSLLREPQFNQSAKLQWGSQRWWRHGACGWRSHLGPVTSFSLQFLMSRMIKDGTREQHAHFVASDMWLSVHKESGIPGWHFASRDAVIRTWRVCGLEMCLDSCLGWRY